MNERSDGGMEAGTLLRKGLIGAMAQVGKLRKEGEIFVSEMLVWASSALTDWPSKRIKSSADLAEWITSGHRPESLSTFGIDRFGPHFDEDAVLRKAAITVYATST